VRGRLLGADGQPTAGEIRLVANDVRDTRYQRAKADKDGRFELLLTEGGTFELVGGVEGQTAAHVQVVLTEGRPHGEATLRLTPFVVVAGRAVDERGDPCAGVHIGLSPIGERDHVSRCRADVQGIFPRGPTAADGTFRFLAPAGYGYRVGYRATPHLYVRGPDVTPPAEDVVLVVREADQRGFTLTGRGVAEGTGAVVPVFRVYLVEHAPTGGHSDQRIATTKDGTFTVGPLPVGRRYSLRFEAEGLGTSTAGPFDATVRTEQVVARLPDLGSLACTVLRPDGTPAVGAHVALQRAGEHPFERAHQGDTDDEGRIQLGAVTPDEYTIHAAAAVRTAGQAQATVTILPRQQATITLTLQRP
jgi:5-hydroxyisourate hydrolase-like protein (transthyretin family)